MKYDHPLFKRSTKPLIKVLKEGSLNTLKTPLQLHRNHFYHQISVSRTSGFNEEGRNSQTLAPKFLFRDKSLDIIKSTLFLETDKMRQRGENGEGPYGY